MKTISAILATLLASTTLNVVAAGRPSPGDVATTSVRTSTNSRSPHLPGLNGFAAVANTDGGIGQPSFIVTRTDDGETPGTLRWATAQAKISRGGWIGFAPALAGQVLRLRAPIRLPSNVTLDGGSARPTIVGAAEQTILVISAVSNVVVSNLHLRSDLVTAAYKGGGDCITVARGADRIWITHNLLGRCGDGQLDITQNDAAGPMRVTVAFNHFTAHDKVSIVEGASNSAWCDGLNPTALPPVRVTFYRNYFDGTGQRHPRVGGAAFVHFVENVVNFRPQARDRTGEGGSYGSAVTEGASLLVERSLYQALDPASAANARFIDTRGARVAPGGCAMPGRLRLSQVLTRPAVKLTDQEPTKVPEPPYAIPAGNLQGLFDRVRQGSGPR